MGHIYQVGGENHYHKQVHLSPSALNETKSNLVPLRTQSSANVPAMVWFHLRRSYAQAYLSENIFLGGKSYEECN